MARRARQGHLPTMEPPSIKEIEQAAEKYVDARDSRMELGREEEELKEKLHELMIKHELTTYEYDGRIVELINKEPEVKVRKAKNAESNGDGEEE